MSEIRLEPELALVLIISLIALRTYCDSAPFSALNTNCD